VTDFSAAEVTAIVNAMVRGDDEPADQLLAQAYSELRETARALLRREREGHTLQPTALVHEAYLLLGKQQVNWKNRAHFCAVAAIAMRRILVKYAVRRSAVKRGGGRSVVVLDGAMAWYEERCVDLLALTELLNTSPRTIHREWNSARAWLRGQILDGDIDDGVEC
jgi:RNA polymerase sigma-70 factor, ECF subfamily